jgi:NO-binding membrane sensor protein with MHYT domain
VGKLVLRVLACITTEHDYSLLLLAALICAATSFMAFYAYSYTTPEHGSRRAAWVFLTAVCTGAGIWATHFVAMLAYDPGQPADYDSVLTIASLLIAAVAAVAGFGISVRGGRPMVFAGGAVIGAGIGLMHFTGMSALIIPGTLSWDPGLVLASIVIGILLASVALLAWHELEPRKALWIAPGLLTLAICGLHFTAMAAITVVPDPRIVVHPSAINSSTLAIAVTAVTMLVLLALLAIALITSEGKRDALVRNQELVDAALEGLVVAKDGVIVNVNRRILKLTLNTPAELLGKSISGDLVILPGGKVDRSGKATEGLLRTATGLVVAVEVECRPLSNSARANEVYAVRDLTDRRRIEQELRRQNSILQEQEEELRIRNRRFEATLANLPHGLCMIDRERRVLVCNKRYVDMYDLPAELVKPGTSIKDIFEYLVGKGLYAPIEGEEYRSKGFSALFEPAAKTRRLSDGRVIQV